MRCCDRCGEPGDTTRRMVWGKPHEFCDDCLHYVSCVDVAPVRPPTPDADPGDCQPSVSRRSLFP